MKNLRNKQVISMKTTICSNTPATKMVYNLSLKSLFAVRANLDFIIMLIFGNQNLRTTVRAEKYVLVIMSLPQHGIQFVRNRLVGQYVELHLSGIHVIIATRQAIRTDIPVVRTPFDIPRIYQSSLALEAVVQIDRLPMLRA